MTAKSKSIFTDIVDALKLLVADLAGLSVPAKAAGVAAIAAPIVAAVLGVHLTAAEVTGWLVAAGGIAATIDRLFLVQKAKAAAKAARAKRAL